MRGVGSVHGAGIQTEYTRNVDDQSDRDPGKTEHEGEERPLSDSLREAVEGAFAATGLTRDRAQELTDRTRDRAQDLVGEVSRMGQDARGALEGLRVVGREEFDSLVGRVEALERRIRESGDDPGKSADGN